MEKTPYDGHKVLPARAGVNFPEDFQAAMPHRASCKRRSGPFYLIPDMLDEVCFPHTRGWLQE